MTTKNYTVSIEIRGSYLFAQVYGKRTRETVTEVAAEIFSEAVANHLSRVIVDVRAFDGRLGVLDIYLVVTEVFQKLRGKGVAKAAIVDKLQSSVREWFMETVAVNRGFNFRIFTDLDRALEWLES